jgi:LPS sulfotransferase NodH
LLCKLLQSTGIAGVPDSHFHQPSVSSWLEDHGLSADQYDGEHDMLVAVLGAAIAYGSGNTGIFGLRLQQHSFDFLLEKLGLLFPNSVSDTGRLQAAFGQILFIHLTRADKIEQAVSRLKAEQSGLWHKTADGKELERLSAPRELAYDAPKIAQHVAEMTQADKDWEDWFAREALTPMRISYDDLSRNPSRILSDILVELGLDRSVSDGITPATAKLSDDISRSWVERFRAESSM